MSGTSEEKSLPASEKKIKDAREKGQVLHSPDMVSGAIILSSTAFLISSVTALKEKANILIDEASHIYERPFQEVWYKLSTVAGSMLVTVTLPILAISVIAILFTNLAITRGFVFSVKPIAPDFNRISPASGLKRIFSLKSLVEFLKGLIKIAIVATAFILTFKAGLNALFQAPTCGETCIEDTFYGLLTPLVIIAVSSFLVIGFIDIFLQRWLFLRELRMTKTEMKRERKDTDGDPLIKQERARLRKLTVGSGKVGISQAVMLVVEKGGIVVGIRYVKGETPLPVVVCRAKGEAAENMLVQATNAKIAKFYNDEVARDLARGAAIGTVIPENTFGPVASALVAEGLI